MAGNRMPLRGGRGDLILIVVWSPKVAWAGSQIKQSSEIGSGGRQIPIYGSTGLRGLLSNPTSSELFLFLVCWMWNTPPYEFLVRLSALLCHSTNDYGSSL
jgi:hypothetical protein